MDTSDVMCFVACPIQAARFSYKRSLKQNPVNKIQTATQKRLQDMVKSNTC